MMIAVHQTDAAIEVAELRKAANGESLFEPDLKARILQGLARPEATDPRLEALSPHVHLALAGGYSLVRDPGASGNRGGLYLRSELTRAVERATLGVGEAMGGEGFMRWAVAFAKPFRMPDFFLVSGLFLARVIDRDWRTYGDRRVVQFLDREGRIRIHLAIALVVGAVGRRHERVLGADRRGRPGEVDRRAGPARHGRRGCQL